MFEYDKLVGELEMNIKMLEDKQSKEENEVLRLEASIDENGGDIIEKETILENIESKSNSAASIVCKLLGSSSQSEKRQRDFTDDILGVVALLGTVESNELSRVLARYLGEEQMLAIVCKSYSSPNAYDELSTGLGYSVNGGYLVIYLEDIKAYKGQLGRDPQKTLSFLSPTLPSGRIAGGFVGYAVNLIHIDETYMQQHRTASGYGLRETLFYRLFGELQVYETKAEMNEAKSKNCIKDGAVSLDGGIIRGNGLVSLGSWEPEIQFPVVADESKTCLSSTNSKEILKLIAEKKIDIKKTNKSLEEEKEGLKKAKKKLNAAKEKHSKFLQDKGTSITNLSGVYTP